MSRRRTLQFHFSLFSQTIDGTRTRGKVTIYLYVRNEEYWTEVRKKEKKDDYIDK
jgi:hypothetical protein